MRLFPVGLPADSPMLLMDVSTIRNFSDYMSRRTCLSTMIFIFLLMTSNGGFCYARLNFYMSNKLSKLKAELFN